MEGAGITQLIGRAIAACAAAVLVVGCSYWALTARFQAFWLAPADPNPPLVLIELAPPTPAANRPRAEIEPPPRPLPSPAPLGQALPTPGADTGPPVEITQPTWLNVPRHPERWYPSRAFTAAVQGEVEMECLVGVDGRLACRVLSEAPAGWDFGAAALVMSREYLMQPAMRDGAPARGRYVMRITFSQSGFR